MAKKDDLPAMPFYPGDWLKSPEVRALPPDYRALWFDLLCYMWESTERGVMVKPNGKPYTKDEIIRMVGLDNQNSGNWLTYIIENEVCSVRESDGALYSRRMVKDEAIRQTRKNVGKLGGNPNLVNQNKKLGYPKEQPNANQITENENEDENNSLKEGIVRETKLEPLDERKSQYGGPTFGAVKEFFTQNDRSVDEAVIFWNEYEQKKWYVSNREGEPTRKLKTTRDWMLKAEQWIKKARISEIDRSKNKSEYQQKIENSTYKPAFQKPKNTNCECGCGKPGLMRIDKYLVASRKCYEKLKADESTGFQILGNVIKSLNNKNEEVTS